MFSTVIIKFKEMEDVCKKIMKLGLLFSFGICILATLILFIYEVFYTTPIMFYIGTELFKTSLVFAVEFIICGLAVDTIKKQMV